jgi:hypothetical protein
MKRCLLLSLAFLAAVACSDKADRERAAPARPAAPSPALVRVDTGVTLPADSAADTSAGPATTTVEETPPAVATVPAPRARRPSRPKSRPEPPAYREAAPDTVADTVRVSDTVRVADTVRVPDTVRVTDTIQRSDTVRVADTVAAADTATRTDTVASADSARTDSKPGPTDSAVASAPSSPAPASPVPTPSAASTGSMHTLPAGTEIHVSLNDSISSRRDSAGKAVTAEVMQAVKDAGGAVVIPAGARVRLTVTRLAPAKSRSAADGEIALRVDGIAIGDSTVPVKARVSQIPHELKGRGVTGSEAAKVGAGTAVGAVAGRVIGGDAKGAVIGGVVGAAGGAAVATQTAKRDVVVAPRTAISFVLDAPLTAAVLEPTSP